MLEAGLELLVGTARFAASLPKEDATGRLSITRVMCPDEFHYHVDNSVFTNHAVRAGLGYALAGLRQLADRDQAAFDAVRARLDLAEEEPAVWESVASRLRGPRFLEGGVIEQFDGYGGLPDFVFDELSENGLPAMPASLIAMADLLEPMASKVVKEADVVLLHALYPDAFPDEQKLRDLDYYEARTVLASSLAPSPYGVVAGMLGEPERALRFLRLAVRYNLAFRPREAYHNGLHLAAYAGAWQVIVCGLFGLRMTSEHLDVRPGPIPGGWTRVSVPVRWRGARLTLESDGSLCTISSASAGAAIEVNVRAAGQATRYTLRPGQALSLPVRQ